MISVLLIMSAAIVVSIIIAVIIFSRDKNV